MTRYYGLSVLRGVAAFFIVGCHLNLSPRSLLGTTLTSYCDAFVAVFCCISGFLLVKSTERALMWGASLRDQIIRRVCRLLPLYVYWTVIYLIFGIGFDCLFGGGIERKFFGLPFWIACVFWGNASCHLWYVINLLYVSLAVICILSAGRWSRSAWFWGVLSGILLLVSQSSGSYFCWYTMRLAAFVSLGCSLAFETRFNVSKKLLVGALLVSVAWYNFLRIHQFVRDLSIVLPVMLLMMDATVSDRCKQCLDRFAVLRRMETESLGVYLVHPIVCAGIGSLVMRQIVRPPYSALAVLCDWFGCYAIAFLCSCVLRRMKLNWLLGERA